MKLPVQLLEGRHEPFGAQPRDGGVNFAVFSSHAARIELCVFDADGVRELRRYPLHGPVDGVFQGFLPGAGPGLVYGLRAHGVYEPEAGHRFNPRKLLLDPYAREIVGRFAWQAGHYGYTLGHPDGASAPGGMDERDNAVQALKARVAAPLADSPRASAPRRPGADVVLYELHVKGFGMQHPDIPPALRGSYAGLAHPAAIAHFKSLGVTTLSLLPVHYALDEAALAERGLRNYWGYNTLGFFCPDPRLASCGDDPSAVVEEFRAMVRSLHAQGLEVVLDVVYNHTAEGSEIGPTLSFRGLDNASWYRLDRDDRSRCENLTGCGNTLHVAHPRVTQFVLDSLRYWVQEMGVDGFRFDLAPVLARTAQGYDAHAAFFAALRQDPVLAGVHLIAEPWDAGPGGYQLGRFPGPMLEWNDRFRDAVRGYWLGRGVGRGELARRFTASSDLFHHAQRSALSSVNFVAAHDGFTLADLVSYSHKHNEANGEANRDGRDGELSANFGVEGPSDDPAVREPRERVRRALLATLLLAQGTPMLCAGDEFGNSQQGNNNAYCQDNPIGWLDWPHADPGLRRFVASLLALRRDEPLLRQARWLGGRTPEVHVTWLHPAGHHMQVHDWHDGGQQAFACRIEGRADGHAPRRVMVVFNPQDAAVGFSTGADEWCVALDSSGQLAPAQAVPAAGTLQVGARALVVLRPPGAAAASALVP